MKFPFYLLLVGAVALEAIGDIFFKKWAIEHKNWLIILGMLIYMAGTAFWAISLKYELLSKSIAVFTVLNLVIVTMVGIVMFNEQLTLLNKLGILFGVLSIILLEAF